MPAARSLLAATQANSAEIFDAFKSHADAKRVDTRTTALTLIRNAFPHYHVTEVEERCVSLYQFAAADKAVLINDTEDDAFNSTLSWQAVGEGVEKKKHPGALKDEFRFAR